MIITQTPFRMSFFGGGTDVPGFFNQHEGAVISTTIDKYCYVTVRHLPRFFEYSTELCYASIERVTNIEDIEHPAIRNAMKSLDMHEIRLTYEADLPARTGLGTSSSFAVGMLNAFYALKGVFASKRQLAAEAIVLERDLCQEAGGWQDQIAAAYGGLNKIVFKDGTFAVFPIIISPERKDQLNDSLMLFFTGFTRFSSEIQIINNETRDRDSALQNMLLLVDDAERILTSKNAQMDDFGLLLDETWQLKRHTGKAVSTDSIDLIYEKAKKAGALGGKLLGAGGGGFFLFYVPQERQSKVKRELSGLMQVPFSFEDKGTHVVHFSPETWEER